MPSSDLIKLNIKTSSKVYFDGKVKSVTSYNDTGIFDILALHANFISIIKDKIILISADGIPQEFEIDKGVAYVTGNSIFIYLNPGKKLSK